MRFEVLMVVTILMMFVWVWAPCGLAEDGDSMLLQSIGFYQPVHMVPKPRRTSSIVSILLSHSKAEICVV
jgi:hypothetical protein